ncbi:MAG: hypothetical protein RLZZ28_546 [Bacteroidota bacterium]|jgi:hypothetical protein
MSNNQFNFQLRKKLILFGTLLVIGVAAILYFSSRKA